MKILNTTKQTVLAKDAQKADTVFSRIKGLLGRRNIPEGYGLIITHCRSIHMFFMRFAIDVVFVDKNSRVIGIVEDIKPFRMSPYFWRSRYVVELSSGAVRRTKTEKGDVLTIQE